MLSSPARAQYNRDDGTEGRLDRRRFRRGAKDRRLAQYQHGPSRRTRQVFEKQARRDAREAEGAPLLREYRVKSSIEGSNPSLSASSAAAARIRLRALRARPDRDGAGAERLAARLQRTIALADAIHAARIPIDRVASGARQRPLRRVRVDLNRHRHRQSDQRRAADDHGSTRMPVQAQHVPRRALHGIIRPSGECERHHGCNDSLRHRLDARRPAEKDENGPVPEI